MTTKETSHENNNRSQTRYVSNKGRIMSMAAAIAGIGLAVILAVALSSILVTSALAAIGS